MALPPSIPTSFVPRPSPAGRGVADLGSVLSVLAYLLLALSLLAVIGVFIYGRILTAEQASKDTALASAEAGLDPATVEGFVRLRDQLASGESLLNGHLALSGVFTALEKMLPASVRLSSVHITIDQTGAVLLQGTGVAKSFNALAATSEALSADGRIKDAIFSNMAVNPNNSVSFTISATIDPKLVAFEPPISSAVVQSATTTATTTPTAPSP